MSNRDIVAAHYAAGERGDVPAMIANFRDDIRWVEAAGFPLAGLYIGKTTVVDHVFQVLNAEWQGFGMHPEEIIEEGD
ncbi:MAG: nuclear transport factor 2 family protein, partial [Microbacteriaceae bacterium]